MKIQEAVCVENQRIEEVIANFGQYVSTSAGHSMFPMLRSRRDTIVVRACDRDLEKYEVALYRRELDGAYVLHRVIGFMPDGYIIRGDNCVNKEYVKKSQVIGVLTEFYRGRRHILCNSRAFYAYSRLAVLFHPLQMLALDVYRRIFGRGR